MPSMKQILLAIILFFPSVSHAYLDPGTGSIIIQATIAAFVGIGVALKTYWYKVKRVFTKNKPENGSQNGIGHENDPE